MAGRYSRDPSGYERTPLSVKAGGIVGGRAITSRMWNALGRGTGINEDFNGGVGPGCSRGDCWRTMRAEAMNSLGRSRGESDVEWCMHFLEGGRGVSDCRWNCHGQGGVYLRLEAKVLLR